MAKKGTGALAAQPDFVKWAEKSLHGLTNSHVMLGIWGDGPEGFRYEFQLQIGHCLVEGKPVLLLVPTGAVLPEKLAAAASVIEYYRPNDLDSMQAASKRALARAGIHKQH